MKKLSTLIKKLSILNSQFSTPEGFTLIELIIVIALIGILSAVGTAGLVDYTRTAKVNAAANELITTLNTAKSNALSQVKSSLCSNTDVLDGYNIIINSSTTYRLRAVCSGTNIDINTKSLPANIIFSVIPALPFSFRVLTGGVVGAGSVTISGYGKTKTVSVDSAGNIK